MNKKYRLEFKKMACEMIKNYDNSPIRVANELSIPIKTYEKWLSAYRKDSECFDEVQISKDEQIKNLEKKLKEKEETIEILKKAYAFFVQNNQLLKTL